MLPYPCSTLRMKDLRKIPGATKVRGSFSIGFTQAKMHYFSHHTPKKTLLEMNYLPTFTPMPSMSCHLSDPVAMFSKDKQ